MNRKLVVALVIAFLLSGCRKAPSADETEPAAQVLVSMAKVGRADLREALAITGTLAPLPGQEAKVAPLVAGRALHVYVKAGDHVEKGQVLAVMDPGPLNAQILQQAASLRGSEESLKQAQMNYEFQGSTQRTGVVQAEQNLRLQQAAYDKVLAGSRPQEVAQAQAAVTSSSAALVAAEQNLGRSQTLFSEGLLARKDLEAAQAQLRAAQAQFDSAQQGLSLAKQGNRPQDIQAAKIAVEQAREQLHAAHAQALQTRSKAQDVEIARQSVSAARASLKALQAQLGGLTIRSPIAGTVLGRAVNPGEFLDTTGSVATVANLNRIRLLMSVPVNQLSQVRKGQIVEFTTEAQPNHSYSGMIAVISSAVDPGTNTILVESVVENPNGRLPDDGFANARIILRSKRNILAIPAEAVAMKDGKPTVFVVGSDQVAHAKELELGVRDGGKVEVKSGLKSGDQIAVSGAYELEDGTRVRTGS